jgi:hypothetical protein
MQDVTVARLQSTKVQTPLSLPLLNVMYCISVLRESLWGRSQYSLRNTKEKEVVDNLYNISQVFTLNVYGTQEWIPPACVAWQAGTITLFLLGSQPP